jgi:periplasmic protein TonB
MPAYADHESIARPRERAVALAAVLVVQTALAIALLIGLRVDVRRSADVVQRLVAVTLVKPPPPPQPVRPSQRAARADSAAPKAQLQKLGGSPGAQPAHAPPSVAPIVAIKPTAPSSGGGTGTGPAIGSGAGGGPGGSGYGAGEGGGTDLVQIAGEITPRDYPRRLRERGIGGVVGILFRVEPTGLVSRCTVTSTSGVPELDALTCHLIVQRFRYRPGTDRYGRPIADNIEGEHEWIPRAR